MNKESPCIDNANRPIIGVGVLVWRKQQLLLGRRCLQGETGCWQFPGGHLEAGESVIECAAREVFEETGLSVNSFRQLGYTNKPFLVAQKNYLTLFVSCLSGKGEPGIMEPDKCESWSWFEEGLLPQPLFEPITLFMEQHAYQSRVEHQDCSAQKIKAVVAQKDATVSRLYALHVSSPVIADTR